MHCKRCLTAAAFLAEKSYLFHGVTTLCRHTVVQSHSPAVMQSCRQDCMICE
jgi:hypothetical protein